MDISVQDKEYRKRAEVRDIILNEMSPFDKIIFYSPTQTQRLLAEQGIEVSVNYVIRRYAELDIIQENGLWYQKKSKK